MEVVAEPASWDQFKEEVGIMEEEDAGAGELLTREIKRRLDQAQVHAHEYGNGDANGGEEEEEELKPAEEEEEENKTIVFDPAKVPDIIAEVSARYLVVTEATGSGAEEEDTTETPSPKGKELEAHENGSAQETDHDPSNGKLENGSHQVSNGSEPEMAYMLRVDKTEIFPAEVDKDEHVGEARSKENGSHSSGSHQVSNGAESEMPYYMLQIDKTEIFPAEVNKDEHITEVQPEIEEYDLEKILDKQESHDLYCPNCKSCITRRVILRKRKRTARLTAHDEPPKRPHTEEVPPAPAPGSDEPESPDVFRCLSCFSFFIPTGCNFNIFRIFGRRDQQVDVLPPPASEVHMPPSENCTSWLLSCFQPADSPNQAAAAADSLRTPLLHDAAASGDTTTTTTETTALYVHSHDTSNVKPDQSTDESSSSTHQTTSYVHSHDTSNVKPEQSTDESSSTHQTTLYVHSHDTVVKPEHSTDESSSTTHQTTTTTTTTTITSGTATTSSTHTAAVASTSSYTSSATGIFHNDVMEVITGEVPPPKPAGGAFMGATHHLLGHEDVQGPATPTSENGSFSSHATHTSGFKIDTSNVTNVVAGIISRGDIPTSPHPQAENLPHVTVLVPEDVNLAAPRPEQRDDWDILKAIVYGGLVESITSLSVVAAAASSGAKTFDIFILSIANLIGGLPLIFHNIADLREIQDVDGEDEQVGHYWLQLGRRSKAQLHMVMALISYIICGLLPPVLYGFSFRESNDRENKMMTVAAASFVCIALLALGKAHVKSRPPRTYFKTLMYYLTISLSCSGLSYVAGVLITRLLVHFGIVDQGGASAAPAPPGLLFPHALGAETSAWASF
ncbi:unnamed protein product [Alopecurus aequalis]